MLDDLHFDDWMRHSTSSGVDETYAGAIEAWEVGAEVGNVKNNRPGLWSESGCCSTNIAPG